MLPRALLAVIVPLPLLLLAPQVRAESYVPEQVPSVDLLVVVDSTAAMGEQRAALAAQIDDFIASLYQQFDAGAGSGLSLHVGFVTSDLGAGTATGYPGCVPGGDEGRMRAVAASGCEGPTGSFLRAEVDAWGDTSFNFDGDVGAAVACITPVALDGCAFQQPLHAAMSALDGSNPENSGFLRPDAVLAVLFVTKQDDCSADAGFFDPDNMLGAPSPYRCAQRGWVCTQALDGTAQVHTGCSPRDDSPHFAAPAEIVDGLTALKANPRKVVVGVLRGEPTPVQTVAGPALGPSCGGAAISATPALRLDAVAAGFPDRNATGSICVDPLPLLEQLAFVIRTAHDDNWDGGFGDAGTGGWSRDASTDEPGVSGHNLGCGCAAQGDGSARGGWLLLLLAGLALRRRYFIAAGCRRRGRARADVA